MSKTANRMAIALALILAPTLGFATELSFSVFAPTGIEILPSTGGVGFSFPSLGNEGKNPIALGQFDPITGEIVGGNEVLVAYLNFGTAPLTRLLFPPGIVLSPEAPIANMVVGSGSVLPPQSSPWLGWTIGPESFNAQLGNTGTFYVGFALFSSFSESVLDAPGVTVPINVVVGTGTHFVFPEQHIFSSLGGAMEAAGVAPVPEPESYLLFLAGLGLLLLCVKGKNR
jgi:hypothetical protein